MVQGLKAMKAAPPKVMKKKAAMKAMKAMKVMKKKAAMEAMKAAMKVMSKKAAMVHCAEVLTLMK